MPPIAKLLLMVSCRSMFYFFSSLYYLIFIRRGLIGVKISNLLMFCRYYESYDGDRDGLVHAYAEQSCFSLSVMGASKVIIIHFYYHHHHNYFLLFFGVNFVIQPHGRGGSTFRGDKFIPYMALDRNMTTNRSLGMPLLLPSQHFRFY